MRRTRALKRMKPRPSNNVKQGSDKFKQIYDKAREFYQNYIKSVPNPEYKVQSEIRKKINQISGSEEYASKAVCLKYHLLLMTSLNREFFALFGVRLGFESVGVITVFGSSGWWIGL